MPSDALLQYGLIAPSLGNTYRRGKHLRHNRPLPSGVPWRLHLRGIAITLLSYDVEWPSRLHLGYKPQGKETDSPAFSYVPE